MHQKTGGGFPVVVSPALSHSGLRVREYMVAVLRSILNEVTLLSINPTHYRTVEFEGETLRNAGAGWVCGKVGSGVVERQPSSFFFTLVTGPRRSSSLKLSDTRVYGHQIRAHLVTTTYFYKMVVLNFASELCGQAGSGVVERQLPQPYT